jgi:hypothetical protein
MMFTKRLTISAIRIIEGYLLEGHIHLLNLPSATPGNTRGQKEDEGMAREPDSGECRRGVPERHQGK